MTPLQIYQIAEIKQLLIQNQRSLIVFDVMELFGRAYIRCQTVQIAIKRFMVTGIYTLNKILFPVAEYIEEANK